MNKWKRRIATAWMVLTGKQCRLTDATERIIYVHDAGPQGKIVQLVPWRDQILALDNNGTILLIDCPYESINIQVRTIMKSPRRG
jgi:hypothetical protein